MNPKITFFAAFVLATLTFVFSVSAEKPATAKQPSPFPPAIGQPVAIDRDAMLRDMAARSAVANLNRTIAQRKRQLYTENPKIAELQERCAKTRRQ